MLQKAGKVPVVWTTSLVGRLNLTFYFSEEPVNEPASSKQRRIAGWWWHKKPKPHTHHHHGGHGGHGGHYYGKK